MEALQAALVEIVGSDHVLRGEQEMAPYLTDWRGRYHGRALAVVRPATVEAVAAVVRICVQAGAAVVPQGGNTGLCGGATPLDTGRSVVLCLGRMRQVRALDAANNTLCVEAGVTLAEVQMMAQAADRFFPLALASEGSCQIGGNLSTNAGGVQVLRYGNMRDLVLGLEVVLPDGRIWDGLRGLRKDNTGYDLKHLFVGAEGTLGIITAAVLKLFPPLRRRATAWLAVPDPAAAVAVLSRLRGGCGDRVSAFELVGRPALELVLAHIEGARDPMSGPQPWYVLVELSDTHEQAPLEALLEQTLEVAMEQGEVLDAAIATSLAQAEALWALRENISEAQRLEGISIKHDVAVPVSRIAEFLACAGERLRRAWPEVRIVAFGHIGDGNLHYNLSKPESSANEAFIARTAEVNAVVHDLVHALGGSISAEHGLGQLKREEIRRYKSEVELDLMRSIKQALDPAGLMNPGKVL